MDFFRFISILAFICIIYLVIDIVVRLIKSPSTFFGKYRRMELNELVKDLAVLIIMLVALINLVVKFFAK